jgi:hypothetical protein
MATGDFDLYYSSDPWSSVSQNQQTWLDPFLATMFRRRSTFAPTLTFVKDLKAVNATKIVVSQILDPHPDTTALSVRQIWMPASHIDSRNREITFSRYGGKVAYTKYDELVNFWKQDGQAGMRAIMNRALGVHMMDVLDILARNAYIAGAVATGYVLYAGGATDFNTIESTDLYDPSLGADIQLGLQLRNTPMALSPDGTRNSVVCFTSPGVIYDIQDNEGWTDVVKYANPTALLNYEAGEYKGIRYVGDPRCILWNCGAVIASAPISAAAHAGDGAPDPATTKVDGTYLVGQTTNTVVHYIDVGAFITGDIGDWLVNDIVTLHVTRTSAFGVTNGVNYAEGTLMNRRIVSIDVGNGRICLDQPIMIDYATDLGAGVYGYVTKAQNIHASIFVGARDGIVVGVGQAPQTHTPPPVDDFDSVYRFSWDAFMGYQPYNPEVFEVCFSAGSYRVKGARGV